MNLKNEIESNVLDHGDHARVGTIDMRCLCETLAICFQALVDSINNLTDEVHLLRDEITDDK